MIHFRTRTQIVQSVGAIVAGLFITTESALAQPLPSYNIDRAQISVSGLSSGAYMAHQFHVAFSGSIMGAGIIAGGPYYCSRGNAVIAVYTCMNGFPAPPEVEPLVAFAREQSIQRAIDNVANLQNDRVYLFSGTMDIVVQHSVMEALNQFYRNFVDSDNITYVHDMACGHAIISPDADENHPCGITESPFINNGSDYGNYDQAGEIFKQIYSNHQPLNPRGQPRGTLLTFDQSEIVPTPERFSMSRVGHVYVPTACASGNTPCRLHVAFHGCMQSDDVPGVGSAFYTRAGYNEWAETNAIIVLYPQVTPSDMNPLGCWDFWGYEDHAFYTQSGHQMAAVKAMIDRIASGSR